MGLSGCTSLVPRACFSTPMWPENEAAAILDTTLYVHIDHSPGRVIHIIN